MTRRDASYRRHRRAGQDFDQKYGVDTNRIIRRGSLDFEHPLYKGYMPSRADVFADAFTQLEHSQTFAFEDFVFVDIGAGKGRCLLLASAWPFRAIIGVEISAQLTAIARENLDSYAEPSQRCKDFTLVCTDILHYRFPTEPSVLYMFNPFERPIVELLLHKLEESLVESPRKVVFVYQNPVHGEVFDQSRCFRLRLRGKGYAVYESDIK
jgi:hypothetical protein